LQFPQLWPGRHTFGLYLLAPAVVLGRMTIELDGLQPAYGIIPETVKVDQLTP